MTAYSMRIYVYNEEKFYEITVRPNCTVISLTIRGKQIKKLAKIIAITHKM